MSKKASIEDIQTGRKDALLMSLNQYNLDAHISEFPNLLDANQFNLPQNLYIEEKKINNIGTISNLHKYPSRVMNAVHKATKRVYFGAFPEISHFYCVVDSTLFIWMIADPLKVIEQKMPGQVITAVYIGQPDRNTFRPLATHILLIATNTQLTIVPVSESHFYFENSSSISTSNRLFTGFYISQDGQIFGGDDVGHIHKIDYIVKHKAFKNALKDDTSYIHKANFCAEIKIKDHSLVFLGGVNFLPKILRFNSPIRQIIYDDATLLLATLDSRNHLSLYHCDEDIYTLKNSVESYRGALYSNIQPLPYSDSESCRFIAFTENGDRHFYFTIFNEVESMPRIRPADPSWKSYGTLIYGLYQLNHTFLVFKHHIVITTENRPFNSSTRNPKESFSVIDLSRLPCDPQKSINSGIALSVFQAMHPLGIRYAPIFCHELLYQHIGPIPPVYLMCTNGATIFQFTQPVDRFGELMESYQGNFSKEIRNVMKSEPIEACATVIILAGKNPNFKAPCLHTLYQFSQLKSQLQFTGENHPVVKAFYARVSRLLYPIYRTSLFMQVHKHNVKLDDMSPEHMKIVIPQFLADYPENIPDRLQQVVLLINEYISLLNSGKQIKKSNTSDTKTVSNEIDIFSQNDDMIKKLKNLAYFASYMEQLLRFIFLMKQLKRHFLTELFEKIQVKSITNYRRLLLLELFNTDELNVKFVTDELSSITQAIRFLLSEIFSYDFIDGPKKGDQFTQHLIRDCPIFFSQTELIIIEQKLKLKEIINTHTSSSINNETQVDTTNVNNKSLYEITDLLMNYLTPQFKDHDLGEVCGYLKLLGYYDGIINIALKTASIVDPDQDGLQWLKSKRNQADPKSASFDTRNSCYNEIFKVIGNSDFTEKSFNEMLKTSDELFHYCLYRYLIENERQDYLLSKSTPYLKPYLKEYHPELLWIYYSRHQDFVSASNELFDIAQNAKSIEEKVTLLAKVINFSKGAGLNQLCDEAIKMTKCALIQEEIEGNHVIPKSPQELFEMCSKMNRWDLILRLLSFINIAGETKKETISKAWANMITSQFDNNFAKARQFVISVANEIPGENMVLDPRISVTLLEDFRILNRGMKEWVVQLLIDAGFLPSLVLDAYITAVEDVYLDVNTRATFCFSIAYLIKKGFSTKRVKTLQNIAKWYSSPNNISTETNTETKLILQKFL